MSPLTCPGCGARNAAGAPWCTQCYRSLEVDDEPADELAGDPPVAVGDPPEAGPGPEAAGPAATATGRDVRADEHGHVEWRCAVCDTWSPLEAPACGACGATRTGFGDDRSAEVADERRTVLLSSLLPGLGHISAGRVGSGVARAVFGVGWLLGGLFLAVAAVRAGSGILSAVPLLVGSVAVWVLSVLDARSLARGGDEEYLDGRTLLWLMVVVTCLLAVALLVDAWRLTG